jgi:hypothetical protein
MPTVGVSDFNGASRVPITLLRDLRDAPGLNVNPVAIEVCAKGRVTGYTRKDGAPGFYLQYLVKCIFSRKEMRMISFNQGTHPFSVH